jgi:phosphatidylserine decarboxylase
MFHKEGTKTILFGLIFTAAVLLLSDYFIATMWLQKLLKLVPFDISNHLTIFRNPKRIFTTNENQILAPVDGKVVVIEEVYEGEY